MSSPRSADTKAIALARMTEAVTAYILTLMEAQSSASTKSANIPAPTTSFASYDHFCAECESSVSVSRYVDRLVSYMCCSPEVFIYAAAYLRRLHFRGCPINSRSIHRLFLCSCVTGAKMRDDQCWSMQYYAQVGGVTSEDLTRMELRFLSDMLDFRAEVLPDEYREVMDGMTAALAMRCGSHSSSSDLTGSFCGDSSTSSPCEERSSVSAGSSIAARKGPPPVWSTECDVFWQ